MLIAEALLLGAAATVLGLALGKLIVTSMTPLVERQLGRSAPGGPAALDMDWFTVLCGVVCGILTTCACMLAPLLASRRTPVALALAVGQRGSTDGPVQRRAQSTLIAVEVAACLTLLVGAALMVESGMRMLRVDFGLQSRDVLVAGIGLPQRSYPDAASRIAFYERLLTRSGELSRARGVALSNWWPLQPPRPRDVGRDEPNASADARAGMVAVSPGYVETLGIALRDGRAFTSSDWLGTTPIALVSETLARQLWPGRRAVGERLRVAPAADQDEAVPVSSSYLVVGVAHDVRQGHADEDLADIYVPLLQRPGRFVYLYARVPGAGPPLERELRAALAGVDADVPLGTPRLLDLFLDQAGPPALPRRAPRGLRPVCRRAGARRHLRRDRLCGAAA